MPAFTYIPPARRPLLHAYKYSGTDQSLVSKYILGPYWNWLVSLFPTSIAPNTITLSGLALVLLNFITLLALDGALQCGTDARLQAWQRSQSALADAAAGVLDGSTKAGQWTVVPLVPRFGLPSSIVQQESTFNLWGKVLHTATGGKGSHCIPHWIYFT